MQDENRVENNKVATKRLLYIASKDLGDNYSFRAGFLFSSRSADRLHSANETGRPYVTPVTIRYHPHPLVHSYRVPYFSSLIILRVSLSMTQSKQPKIGWNLRKMGMCERVTICYAVVACCSFVRYVIREMHCMREPGVGLFIFGRVTAQTIPSFAALRTRT